MMYGPGLERVRNAARQRKKEKFTALLHHVTIDLLRDASLALKRRLNAIYEEDFLGFSYGFRPAARRAGCTVSGDQRYAGDSSTATRVLHSSAT